MRWIGSKRRTNFDIDAWLAARRRKHEGNCRKYDETFPRCGPWPDSIGTAALNRLYSKDDIIDKASKLVVIIGLLPTTDPTEVAAHLRFGGWNECLRPPVHICLTRCWRERYGAVQIDNTYEWVEFRVEQPLSDRSEAMDLAMVQYHYRTDSTPETLEVAAAELIGARFWRFWWD
jgi:hypothetical protein